MGVGRQREDCEALCDRLGWTVAHVYTDNDVSAYSGKPRPEWERLISDVKSGRVDAIACWHVDRLTRKPRELEDVIELADTYGLKLATCTGEIDLATSMGRMVARILGATARQESEHKAERQQRERRQSAEDGKNSGGGTRSFGYNQPKRVDDTYVVVPDPNALPDSIYEPEAQEIRWAAQQLLDGKSVSSIRKAWSDRGIETVTNRRTKNGNPFWSRTAVRSILKSPRNAGLRQHKGDLFPAVWPAILDMETYEAVLVVLNDPSRRQPEPSRDYPLRGILTCGDCGIKLSSAARSPDRFYACRTDAGGRGGVWIKADDVEEYVLRVLLVLAESPATLALLESENEADAEQLRALISEKSDYEAKLARVEDKFADDLLPTDAYVRNRKRLEGIIDPLTQRIAQLRGNFALGLLGPGLKDAWPTMTPDDQRSVLLAIVENVKITPRVRRGGNKFDPSRITFGWRAGALAQAVGVGDDGKLDPERLHAVWRTGALHAALGFGDPEKIHVAVSEVGEYIFENDGAYAPTGLVTIDGEAMGVILTPEIADQLQNAAGAATSLYAETLKLKKSAEESTVAVITVDNPSGAFRKD